MSDSLTYREVIAAAIKLAEQVNGLVAKYVSPSPDTPSVEEAVELPEVKAEIDRLEAEFKQVLREYLGD